MAGWLRPEEYVHLAKQVPVGSTRKYRHNCGSRESMAVGNEGTHYWAYCHRCDKRGRQDKQAVFDPTPTPITPRKAPEDVRALVPEDIKDAGRNRLKFDRWLVHKITSLRYSPQHNRVYLPGALPSDCAFDITGKAQAAWYSTARCQVFARPTHSDTEDPSIRVCSTPEEYLTYFKQVPCLGIFPRGKWITELINFLTPLKPVRVVCNAELAGVLRRELSAFDIEVTHGGIVG